ncbi:maleylacetoacetate isomerase [Abyssibius alkaniclasticus]|uniref:maleylacetoacetate isomerase n=1 Tax=Abyssibius alkaniclasticus TaxID=2881234 RepID=UPI004058062B
MIRLHDYWRSSAAYRLRIALNLMGVAYEQVAVNLLAGAHETPAHLALNPQGLVPVLEIDGLVMTQSLAIIEYLDEVHAAGFLPEHPAGRARVRALSYAIAMETAPICNLSVRTFVEQESGGKISADAWQLRFITRGLAAFETMLATGAGDYCYGDRVSMADICLVPQLYNARRAGVDLSAMPLLCAIDARLAALPAVAAALPENNAP